MFKIVLKFNIVLFLFFLMNTCFAQSEGIQEKIWSLSKDTNLVWYGIDFSRVKLIDKQGFKDVQEIKDQYFNSINLVVIGESKKYDLANTFKNKNITSDLSVIHQQNFKPNVENLVIDYTQQDLLISEKDIPSIISEYNTTDTSGIGIVLIMQSMIKISGNKTANMYVTLFDVKTKEIKFTKLMSAKPGGFGFRNYWARTVKNVLDSIRG